MVSRTTGGYRDMEGGCYIEKSEVKIGSRFLNDAVHRLGSFRLALTGWVCGKADYSISISGTVWYTLIL